MKTSKDADRDVALSFVNIPAWATALSRYVGALLKLHGLEYSDLSARLAAIGVEQSAANLRAKIAKGTFGAQLFLQIMYVLEEDLDMARIVRIVDEVTREEAARGSG